MIQLFLYASGSVMSEDEILAAIPASTLAEIKKKDPHPYFRAFVVAHEGVAEPFVKESSGFVKKIIKVFRSAILSMKGRPAGAKYYDDYHKQSGPRTEIGREVAHVQKEVNGNLHDISIAYSEPSQAEAMKQKDIVSMEADADFDRETDDTFVLRTIKRVAAYATGKSSDGAAPAWAGAKSVGALYAFTETPPQRKEMTEEEIRALIAKQNGGSGPQPVFKLTADGFPDPHNTPHSVAEHIVKSFVQAKTIRPSQVWGWKEIFGERVQDGNGQMVWVGGDADMRAKLLEHEKGLVEPLNQSLKKAEVYQGELVQYRAKDFRADLAKAAEAEADKHKFDANLKAILAKRIERGDGLQLDPAVLLAEEKERAPKLEAVRGEYIKAQIEAVRDEWQAGGGKPEGDSTPAPAGNASNGGDW